MRTVFCFVIPGKAQLHARALHYSRKLLPFLIILCLSSCKHNNPLSSWTTPPTNPYIALLLDSSTTTDFHLYAEPTVKAIYSIYDYAELWSNQGKLKPSGRELLALINNCDKYGLFPGDFHEYELCAINPDAMNEMDAARLDLLLTDSYVALAHQLRNGTIDKRTMQPHDLHKVDTLLIISLHEGLKAPSIKEHLRKHEPEHFFYRAFKDKLKRLQNELEASPFDPAIENEILTLSVNLERWRWEYKPYPDRYIFVNIPSFSLYVFDNDEVIFKSKVIVGSPQHPTPVFTSITECFILYPYWHVPRSIATKELLPEFKKDPSRVQRQHFDVLDKNGHVIDDQTIDWNKYSTNNFPFVLRQREGIDNALGVIKFGSDNPYGVYMHDTNAKNLFAKSDRALSHGCIRVEKAKELATLLINRDSLKQDIDLDYWINARIRKEFSLPEPIPVFVCYFTHDEERSYPDIYQKNDKLIRAIMSPAFSLILSDNTLNEPASPASGGQ